MTEDTSGEAAERLLHRLGVTVTPETVRAVVDALIDVQRATVEARNTGGIG